MKLIRFSVKQTKFLLKYFAWVPFVYFIGTVALSYYIFDIFGIHDKLSFPLYECPGFFLCFLDHLPPIIDVAGEVVGSALKDPLPALAGIIIFLIIFVPPAWIFLGMLTFEGKKKSK